MALAQIGIPIIRLFLEYVSSLQRTSNESPSAIVQTLCEFMEGFQKVARARCASNALSQLTICRLKYLVVGCSAMIEAMRIGSKLISWRLTMGGH